MRRIIKKEVQVAAVFSIVVALGLIYGCQQISDLQGKVNRLESTTSTVVEALYTRVEELENLIVECGVTIDDGSTPTIGTVHLTKGATALDALRRIAVVETTYYAGVGEFIDSINGVSNDPGAGKYWMWYIWENEGWVLAPVGAGNYGLNDGDNIKFSYETPSF